ncbi:MAG: adenine/guanine/hypoxanthine permease [Oceanotoga sp.]|jgi:AGZA family xanthine/uracil permease-like MFS transporter|uniref:AGZA family xanthine/uracil permease-like MFS transporter n=1 Tax=Oceanotoga teriensis TaxID=515440 RepID=A0AA45C4K4_9BACT|nr:MULTISPECIES: uracil permease [Oceanotoga]MDN5341885.1 adenine/guanine/hypoxanthine permease [Oceanotoga sp.]PWJ86122.1 AGZA family xanthine/uracil permease-like MFS transporter [Oceanotoga teriensis]
MNFKYKWWGKGDLDASFGLFFDGFSKIFTAVGIMLFVFGMPVSLVIGKMLPAIGLISFLGNFWYFYEAKELAKKEKRHDVTSQPFGIGGPITLSWIFLIMGPVYWKTGDSNLAFQVGLAAGFIGGLIEILGAFIGNFLIDFIPKSALLGNLASGAFVWLSISGILVVFNKPEIAVLPLLIVIMSYLGNFNLKIKIPAGILAIILGTFISWANGYMNFDKLITSFNYIGFYTPNFFIKDIFIGLKEINSYLPVIIPLQIANFLTTLQGVESAKLAGDSYPQKRSMLMDGLFTLIGSLIGNPFPTTVYYGHPGWKSIDARAGYSLVVGITYLLIGFTGISGVMMNIIPYEVVMILLIFVGLTVTVDTFEKIDKKYFSVILISLLPIVAELIKTLVNSAINSTGIDINSIPVENFQNFNLPMNGLNILGSGAFLSSLLIACWLACLIDKDHKKAFLFGLILSFCSCIGLIHNDKIAFLPKQGLYISISYLIISLFSFKIIISKFKCPLKKEKEEKTNA